MIRLLAIALACTAVLCAQRRPNVVVILADDLGYECLTCNGGGSYETPNLDALAAGGARFTNAHVQPLCTPTRVQVMTGQYNVRNYVGFGQLKRGEVTFGNLLRDAGYRTGIAGKWQLGRVAELPKEFGFDEHVLWQHTRFAPRYPNPGLEHQSEQVDYENGEYGPDLISDFAVDFVERHRDAPFLLYYPMILPHFPHQATPDSDGWDPTVKGENKNKDDRYVLTRADQSRYTFDQHGFLRSVEDTNGVRMDFEYASDRLQKVIDDQGHVITYVYEEGRLARRELLEEALHESVDRETLTEPVWSTGADPFGPGSTGDFDAGPKDES